MTITVFTPVYNRAHLIKRLYDSLCRQTSKAFDWLVIDDGSQDNIDEVMNGFIEENKVKVTYLKQPNSGKHIAINRGVKVAKGEMFYIVDSDDFIPDDAIEFIVENSKDIIADDSFAGIVGLDETIEGKSISNFKASSAIDDTYFGVRYVRKIRGDMAEVYKTKILKKYPYPITAGEKYCAESYAWNQIGNDGFKLRYFPKVIKIIEYQPDGLSSDYTKIRAQSPYNTTLLYSQLMEMRIPLHEKIKAAINFWRFRFWIKKIPHSKSSIKFLPFYILGYCIYRKDLKYLNNLKEK